jgi:hypothetical protein
MSMKSVCTVWLFGLASLAGSSGCIIGDGGDDSAFTVGWETAYVGSKFAGVSCAAAGTPTVELTMTNLSNNRVFVNRFNCAAGGGQSETLPPGKYTVKIALKNQNDVEVSNQVGDFSIVRHGLTDLGIITFEIQSFHLSWSLARGSMSLACQDVDARTVNVITRLNSEAEVTYSFPCPAGSGSSPAILIGTYSVRLQLVSSTGAILWDTASPMTIPVNDEVRAELPVVVFNL